MKRRDFIIKTGITSAGLYLANKALAQSEFLSIKKDKLGIALVGLGGYATGQLGPALLETEHCYLAGIVTGTKEKEQKWLDKYEFPEENIYNYDTFDAIAENKDIDIVYVVLPNSMHKEYVLRAARAGKHVICEKPMAISVEDCEEMIQVCEENKVKLSIGYRMHFDPTTKKLKELAKEKPYGNISVIESEFCFTIGKPDQWRLRKEMAGGGALYDIGVYCIQGARYATGEEPVAIWAQEFKTDYEKFKEVDETITFQMLFPSGAMANCTTSYNAKANRLHITAGKTPIYLKPAFSYKGVKGMIGKEVLEFPRVNQQAQHMDNVALSIKTGKNPLVTGDEGMRDMKIMEAIYKSIKKGEKKVSLG